MFSIFISISYLIFSASRLAAGLFLDENRKAIMAAMAPPKPAIKAQKRAFISMLNLDKVLQEAVVQESRKAHNDKHV